jgi:hypothetical protein
LKVLPISVAAALRWPYDSRDMTDKPPALCPLCHRALIDDGSTDRHHLVPRSHGGQEQVELHKVCHQAIHALLSEAELAREFSTVDALRAHPALARFIAWVQKRPPHYQDRSKWSRVRRRK